MSVDVASNLAEVWRRIHAAENTFGRKANSVQLLAVSKTKSPQAIRRAYAAGQRCFGESYAQEAQEKIPSLADLNIDWHYIGPIQSNKTKLIADTFSWVHSIDRLKIAQRLNEQRSASLPPLNVCIQVNISAEASKSGVAETELLSLAQAIMSLRRLKLCGLMAIPAPAESLEQQRLHFARLRSLRDELQHQLGVTLDTLSMGMSDDLEAAIAEGATIVRVGTDIFGERETG
jgi:pyridoxal phosphate enzyme (YggS family)